MKPTLAVVLNVRNEGSTLRSVLEAAAGFDEYVVADMESTDDTVAIAQGWGASILRIPNAGFCEPGRQPALEAVNSDWALILDGDEYLSRGGNVVLREAAERAHDSIAGLRIVRHAYIGQRRIRGSGWEPRFECPVRFVRPCRVKWPPTVHAVPQVDGEIATLDEAQVHIRHENFRDLYHFFEKNIRYAQIEGQQVAADRGSLDVVHGLMDSMREVRRRYSPELEGSLSLTLALGIAVSRMSVELFAAEALEWPEDIPDLHELLETTLGALTQHDGEAGVAWSALREADKAELAALTEELEAARGDFRVQASELEGARATVAELRCRFSDLEVLALRPQQDLAARLNGELEAATELNVRLLADLKATQASMIAWQLTAPTCEARREGGPSAASLLGRLRRVTPGK